MMELLAYITKYGIDNRYITYEELYVANEEDLIYKLKKQKILSYLNILINLKI